MAEDSPARPLRIATPIALAVFLASATTGLLLFFHLGERLVKELHEWIGVGFVAAALLHILRNRRALRGYLRRPTLWIAAAVVAAIAAAFVIPALGAAPGGGDGQRRLLRAVASAPLDDLAPILHVDAADLGERLGAAGFTVASTQRSLIEIAEASNRSPREAIDVAIAALPAPRGPEGR